MEYSQTQKLLIQILLIKISYNHGRLKNIFCGDAHATLVSSRKRTVL